MNVACAMHAHRLGDFVFEIVQISHGGSGDIGNVVCHGNLRHVLALAENVAWLRPHRHGGRGTCGWRRGAGALHACVHVSLAVVADVEHVIVALEHAGQAAETDVGGAAVSALGNHAHIVAPLDFHRRSNARGDRCGVTEYRMYPWNLPRGFRVGCGKHFQAACGIRRNKLVVASLHRGIDGIACAQCFTAALTGAVAGVERIGAAHVSLHATLFG